MQKNSLQKKKNGLYSLCFVLVVSCVIWIWYFWNLSFLYYILSLIWVSLISINQQNQKSSPFQPIPAHSSPLGDIWQVTGDRWYEACASWHVTPEMRKLFFNVKKCIKVVLVLLTAHSEKFKIFHIGNFLIYLSQKYSKVLKCPKIS